MKLLCETRIPECNLVEYVRKIGRKRALQPCLFISNRYDKTKLQHKAGFTRILINQNDRDAELTLKNALTQLGQNGSEVILEIDPRIRPRYKGHQEIRQRLLKWLSIQLNSLSDETKQIEDHKVSRIIKTKVTGVAHNYRRILGKKSLAVADIDDATVDLVIPAALQYGGLVVIVYQHPLLANHNKVMVYERIPERSEDEQNAIDMQFQEMMIMAKKHKCRVCGRPALMKNSYCGGCFTKAVHGNKPLY